MLQDPVVDYRKAKERAAGCLLPGMLALKITGPDRKEFLQGQISCDAKSATPEKALASCLLTPKGRLTAHFELFERDDHALLVGPEAQMQDALKTLSHSIVLTDSKIETEALDAVWLSGPAAEMLVEGEGASQSSLGGPEGFALLVKDGAAKLKALAEKAGGSFSVLCPDALEMLRVEAGRPLPGRDYDEEFFPQELGLDAAVCFTKGCFRGQETLAHIKNRGHLNRKLVGVKAPAQLRAGASVLAFGEPVGKVTSAVFSPALNAHLGLAVLKASHMTEGSLVLVAAGGGTREAEVVALPVAA